MRAELETDLEFAIVNIARLIEEGHELEAVEEAKAVCDTLATEDLGEDAQAIHAQMAEFGDYLMAS